MKITSEILPESQIRFNIEIEGAYSRNIYDHIVKGMMRSVKVPGFRPGKAPKQLVIKQVGAGSVRLSVLEQLVQDALKEIFAQKPEDKELIGEPKMEPDIEEMVDTFTIGEPLLITFTTDFYPEVTLGDYKNLKIIAGKVDPNPYYVEDTLYDYRYRNATLVPVEDRPVEPGDLVDVESEVINLADNTIVEQLTTPEIQLDLNPILLHFELFNMILGMELNEVREEEMTLPEEFPVEELRGQLVKVKHRVLEIKCRELPPLDDDFARSVSQKKDLEELRAFLQERAVKEAESETEVNIEEAILSALTSITTVDPPYTLVTRELGRLVGKTMEELGQKFQIDGTELFKIMPDKLKEELEKHHLEEAVQTVIRDLALLQLFKLENLQVPRDRYEANLQEIKEMFGHKSYNRERVEEYVEESLQKLIALEWLREQISIELIPEEELEEEDPATALIDVVPGEDPVPEVTPIDETQGEEPEPPEGEDLVHNTDS